jgi:uncharacterized protein YxjI
MIFCKKCGRYNQDGQATCTTCGADLKSAGHASFSGGNVQIRPAPQKPALPPAHTPEPSDVDSMFKHDKFLLRQKALAINEKYYVQDEHGNPLMFVEHLVPKRHVEFFTDDTKTKKLLEVKQLNKVEFPFANFAILDSSGNVIGKLRKNALFDYIRRRWYVMNGNGLQLCIVKEDSLILSLFRRTGIPIFAFMRTNFIFLRGQSIIGEFNRKFTILDRYVLDMTTDSQQSIDRRIAVATGVMLDTGELR